jgi:hypothetical protein
MALQGETAMSMDNPWYKEEFLKPRRREADDYRRYYLGEWRVETPQPLAAGRLAELASEPSIAENEEVASMACELLRQRERER